MKNMSDIIEEYLKQVLSAHDEIEIKRNEVAGQFNCVPSQINYVINTRFTAEKGYLVESKRGGGGYIRIVKVKLLDDVEMLNTLIDLVGESISQNDGYAIVSRLYENEMVTKREATLMLTALDKQTLMVDAQSAAILRARILIAMLQNLKVEN